MSINCNQCPILCIARPKQLLLYYHTLESKHKMDTSEIRKKNLLIFSVEH